MTLDRSSTSAVISHGCWDGSRQSSNTLTLLSLPFSQLVKPKLHYVSFPVVFATNQWHPHWSVCNATRHGEICDLALCQSPFVVSRRDHSQISWKQSKQVCRRLVGRLCQTILTCRDGLNPWNFLLTSPIHGPCPQPPHDKLRPSPWRSWHSGTLALENIIITALKSQLCLNWASCSHYQLLNTGLCPQLLLVYVADSRRTRRLYSACSSSRNDGFSLSRFSWPSL